jgi:Flp pilus assembly pilin Flp
VNDESWNLSGEMKRIKRQKGVTTVEYAIMLALIAILVATANPNISTAVVSVFSRTANCLSVSGSC